MANEDLRKALKSSAIMVSPTLSDKYAVKQTVRRVGLSAYVRPEIVDRLKEVSMQTGKTISNLIEIAIEECWEVKR